jgi:hypothetical protein
MSKTNKIENPKPEEKVCFNCKHLLWMVGIGQGLKCDLDRKSLSSRYYTCEKFEMKIKA